MLILDTATRHGNGGEKVRLTLMKIRVDKKKSNHKFALVCFEFKRFSYC